MLGWGKNNTTKIGMLRAKAITMGRRVQGLSVEEILAMAQLEPDESIEEPEGRDKCWEIWENACGIQFLGDGQVSAPLPPGVTSRGLATL